MSGSLNKNIERSKYGVLHGEEIFQYTLTNRNGMSMKVISYGGIITHLTAPDRHGNFEDVVLGCDTLEEYTRQQAYLGALIGRYGNRIANGKFSLNGIDYKTPQNNGPNTLHGGTKGFNTRIWDIQEKAVSDGAAIELFYTSADCEMGFPGELKVVVTYHLTDDNAIRISYRATTDKTTVISLTQHSYFNLSGETKRSIELHDLQLVSEYFLPVDDHLIPIGQIRPVAGSPFDFTRSTTINSRLRNDDPQLKAAGGYDHCWIFSSPGMLSPVATLTEKQSGRVMEMFTSEPGVQFYSGNFLDGSILGKNGNRYEKHWGLCLESQHYPDSPNHSAFPSVILNPGEVYTSQTVYRFSTI